MGTYEPRIPTGEEEAFAWGFMLGYRGEAPEEMVEVLPELETGLSVLEGLTDVEKLAWKRGYDSGLSTYCDHGPDRDNEVDD